MGAVSALPVAAFLSLCLVSRFTALPNGAPISACESMSPVHIGVQPQPEPAPYTIRADAPSFRNAHPVSVVIEGPDYRGLLLEARTFGSTELLGSWINPPLGTKNLLCPQNRKGAITHSNTSVKTNATTYTWLPPDKKCPRVITFMATVAQSHDVFWVGIQSAVLYKDPAATCTAGTEKITWTSSLLLLLSGSLFYLLGDLQ